MVWSSKQDIYSQLRRDDSDIENHSDTTLDAVELFEDETKQPNKHTRNDRTQLQLNWIAWVSVIVLQVAILVLLKQNGKQTCKPSWTAANTETGGDINGLYIPSMSNFGPISSPL
jgi:hypothetical protein